MTLEIIICINTVCQIALSVSATVIAYSAYKAMLKYTEGDKNE